MKAYSSTAENPVLQEPTAAPLAIAAFEHDGTNMKHERIPLPAFSFPSQRAQFCTTTLIMPVKRQRDDSPEMIEDAQRDKVNDYNRAFRSDDADFTMISADGLHFKVHKYQLMADRSMTLPLLLHVVLMAALSSEACSQAPSLDQTVTV